MNSRRICVVTGTRADYGLLRWLMQEIKETPSLTLQTAVSNMHLVPEYGLTVDDIRADGFTIDAEVACLVSGDTTLAMGKSMGLAVIGFTDTFCRLQSDLVVILGDRYEAFSAASAATALNIPIAHIHGGERTEGAVDEAFRHSITKMSHLHFAAAEEYGRRIMQLGEDPQNIYVVGSVGLENFCRLPFPDVEKLSSDIDFDLTSPYLLMTYHPATLDMNEGALDALLTAVQQCDLPVLMTKANSDPGGRAVNLKLEKLASERPQRFCLVASLGQVNYLAAMRHCAAVVGNSSSGIIEAPAIDIPVVNIGSRQAGRLRAAAVIDSDESSADISRALKKALDPAFRSSLLTTSPPYGRPSRIARTIADVLESTPLNTLVKKRFRDVEWT